jgi:hypothetical protein
MRSATENEELLGESLSWMLLTTTTVLGPIVEAILITYDNLVVSELK